MLGLKEMNRNHSESLHRVSVFIKLILWQNEINIL